MHIVILRNIKKALGKIYSIWVMTIIHFTYEKVRLLHSSLYPSNANKQQQPHILSNGVGANEGVE